VDRRSLMPSKSGYIPKVVHDLLCHGWNIESVPVDGKLPRNGLKLILRTKSQEARLRIFAYKVTTSGRNRPLERRIEITTTYQGGLSRIAGFQDVVLGIDAGAGKYVGVDSRRLNMGGSTHNASSFFDLEGLSAQADELLINPRRVASPQFPESIEQHAFFDSSRLAEYLLNHADIHSGRYSFQGLFSGKLTSRNFPWFDKELLQPARGDVVLLSSHVGSRRTSALLPTDLIDSVGQRDFSKIKGRRISPSQLKEILAICEEIGVLGEQVVLDSERKRLRKRGLVDQARKVERVSLWSVAEGYDILSFEDDGFSKRYLEVKTTVGQRFVVDVSSNEWEAARRYGPHYFLVRVTNIKKVPKLYYLCNPRQLESQGKVVAIPSGWRLDLKGIMKLGAYSPGARRKSAN
jgi:hypothetical protein